MFTVVQAHSGVLLSHEKERGTDTHYNMDGP